MATPSADTDTIRLRFREFREFLGKQSEFGELRERTKILLNGFYDALKQGEISVVAGIGASTTVKPDEVTPNDLPPQKPRLEWTNENKRGFFLGFIEIGMKDHIEELNRLLSKGIFEEQQGFSSKVKMWTPKHPITFIDFVFGYYVLPWHTSYSDTASCHTPHSGGHKSGSQPDEVDVDRQEHKSFKRDLLKRDRVCLFCWRGKQLEAAHIISKKLRFPYEEKNHLLRANLNSKHVVQNGLLLCSVCHGEFDRLKQYVDTVGDQMVIKVVNESNDPTSEKHETWAEDIELLVHQRSGNLRVSRVVKSLGYRRPVESNGEIALYFADNDPKTLPNLFALYFHRCACLIWRMAGGAESEEESCPDADDDWERPCVPSPYQAGEIHQWIRQLIEV